MTHEGKVCENPYMLRNIVVNCVLLVGAALSLIPAPARAGTEPVPEGSEFQVNTYTTSNQKYPAVGPDGTDGFVVVWESDGSSGSDDSNYSIQGQRYASDGSTVNVQFQVNTYTTSYQRYSAVGANGAGGFTVVWNSIGSSSSDSFYSIQGQRYTSDGSAADGQFQVNTYTTSSQFSPAVASVGAGGLAVVWNSDGSNGSDDSSYSIQGQRYSSDGSKAGIEFQVNTYTTSLQIQPAVGRDGTGGFVVVWNSNGSNGSDDSNYSIQGQRYTSDGSKAGIEFQINTYTTSSQWYPAVGPDGTGGFVAVWNSNGSSGSDDSSQSIQGQRYASDGSTVNVQFQVNTYTTSIQFLPAVGPDGAGGFIVVWTSTGSSGGDSDDRSIQSQRYASDGSTLGGEFQVNTYTTSSQEDPAVGSDGIGNFVVVWESDGSSDSDDSNYSIQGQRYRLKIFEDGFESGDTSAWSNTLP